MKTNKLNSYQVKRSNTDNVDISNFQINDEGIKGLYSFNKKFIFDERTIYCYRVDGLVSSDRFLDFNKRLRKNWWRPQNSNEINTIARFYETQYSQMGLDKEYTWIITYGVAQEASNSKINGISLAANSNCSYNDMFNPPGNSWVAFRKHGCSFCNVNKYNILSCWDNLRYSIICLEETNY